MIFRKQRFFGWSFWVLLTLSMLFLVLDQKKIFVPRLKTALQIALMPLQYTATLPERGFQLFHDYLTTQHTLVHNQKNWQEQQLLLQAKLQEMNALKQQNQELHSLLNTPIITQQQKYLLARVIFLNTETHTRALLINRGSRSGVSLGEGVVSADGVIGQIIQVTPTNSRVLLLSDERSAIPVINARTQENFIAVGKGNNHALSLLDKPSNNANLKIGDALLSSGIGGHYPAHYPVGTITHLGKNNDSVQIQPAANLERLNLVLVVFVKDEASL